MQKILTLWHLRQIDLKRLASFVWKTAVVIFGLQFILDLVASILYIYAFTEPALSSHRLSGFDAPLAELSGAATMLLQLLATRFAIGVALRLATQPMAVIGHCSPPRRSPDLGTDLRPWGQGKALDDRSATAASIARR
jgi:hypothetical protein